MIQQVDDFHAEAAELHRLLNGLDDGDWARPTQFKAWTIDDIVRHLHMGDTMALASASDPAQFAALRADIQAERDKGLSRIAETRQRLNGLAGRALLQRWHETAERLCEALAAKPADARLKWAGPDMGVRMFTTARQMETWSHAQAIYDLLGVERPAPSPRLRNIAEIGVRTFGWAYRNRGLPVPAVMPSVRLDTPFGETWEWNASPSDAVEGDAVAFCQVVTQTRNVADTSLDVRGEAAKHWMSIVQCFAGPPETPPVPGIRHRSREASPMSAISPFRIAVGDDVLEDLRTRLRRTRWPEAELVSDWSQGIPRQWVQEVCRYWAEQYDWRKREALLNRFPQFTTNIDGLDIHFVHARSPHAGAMPLLITHGWPGSIVEFHKVIEPLVDPAKHGGVAADAFHVICPSLPGFGFSGKPTTTGWGIDRIARAWAALMERLGYARYGAQGGDWGSAVTTAIGGLDAAHCAGIHITLAMATRPNVVGEPTPEEARALKGIKHYADWDSGYSKQQSTRPQTVGYGLTDSPAGQAAWILEKFWAWTDCDGHPENILGRDELLDNVMLYWVTATAASSARLYWESFGPDKRTVHKVGVPTGVAVFPKEIVTPVRRWMEGNFTNIQHWSEMPKGGHFAAFEQPALFVDDVRKFFRTLR